MTKEDGSREVVRVALLGPDGPTGTFTRWEKHDDPVVTAHDSIGAWAKSYYFVVRAIAFDGAESGLLPAMICLWAWEDLNLRPLPYQGSALTA
jgi:hypothetical protein